jgi:hypothetical protein
MTAASDQHARRWWILVLVGIAQLMVVLDVTIMNIALPAVRPADRRAAVDLLSLQVDRASS